MISILHKFTLNYVNNHHVDIDRKKALPQEVPFYPYIFRYIYQQVYPPTILTGVTRDMDVAKDIEIFGPVFPVIGYLFLLNRKTPETLRFRGILRLDTMYLAVLYTI